MARGTALTCLFSTLLKRCRKVKSLLSIAYILFLGEPPLHHRMTTLFVALAALPFCAGCIVTTSTYDAKVGEVEALRDAYASSNRETSRLAREVEDLSKQVEEQKTALRELSSRAEACESGLAREKRESGERDRELAECRKKAGSKEEPPARSAAE